MDKGELIQKLQTDDQVKIFVKTLQNDVEGKKFARQQTLSGEALKSLYTAPGNSFWLLYSDLIFKYIMPLPEVKEMWQKCRQKKLSDLEVKKKENKILIDLLTEAGLYAVPEIQS